MRSLFDTVAIGKRLKDIRLEKNMSVAELAYRAGYKSSQSIVNIERGNCVGSESVYRKICKAINVPYLDVVGEYMEDNDSVIAGCEKEDYVRILKKHLENFTVDVDEFERIILEHCTKTK